MGQGDYAGFQQGLTDNTIVYTNAIERRMVIPFRLHYSLVQRLREWPMEYTDFKYQKFEWDEKKRETNISKHNLDFEDVLEALLLPRLEYLSERHDEIRTVAICQETNKIIAVVYVPRGTTCRIISARIARKNEKREYYNYFIGRSPH
jgi:uncharacterized protein